MAKELDAIASVRRVRLRVYWRTSRGSRVLAAHLAVEFGSFAYLIIEATGARHFRCVRTGISSSGRER